MLLLAVFFVWKIFDQNVAEPRIAVILPESGDKRWDALIKGMKQAAAENNVHMIICTCRKIDGPEAEREFIRNRRTTILMALSYIRHPVMRRKYAEKECGNKPYLLIADGLAVKEGKLPVPRSSRITGRSEDGWRKRLRTKSRRSELSPTGKCPRLVQAEICGLNEALEGSEARSAGCIYREKNRTLWSG